VLYCWVRNLDGLAIERHTLERLLGLDRFRPERIRSLRNDLKELFPHQRVINRSSKPHSLATLLLARVPLDGMPSGSMSTEERIRRFKDGTRLELLDIWPEPDADDHAEQELSALQPFLAVLERTDERLLTAYLALVSAGQISVISVPGMARSSEPKPR
jgi:hypothetical protein